MLSMFSKLVRPMRILELGTFTGYSALCLSEGLRKDGTIVTIDKDSRSELLARKYFETANISNQVTDIYLYSLLTICALLSIFLFIYLTQNHFQVEIINGDAEQVLRNFIETSRFQGSRADHKECFYVRMNSDQLY